MRKHRAQLLDEWVDEQTSQGFVRQGLMKEAEVRAHCDEFLVLFVEALGQGTLDIRDESFARLRDMLERISRSRGEQGFTPSETATFVMSMKRPLFARLRDELDGNLEAQFEELWGATELLDGLALFTTEAYLRGREGVINRQQSEMLELSTPVVKLWDGVLALPLIGTLDSARTQTVMETLLQRVVETSSEVVIIDITGVPTVDTLVAQHLLKTVAAARLMGVECIISGVRPQIAQTIVQLGVELEDVVTKANLADAFKLALTRLGLGVFSRSQVQQQQQQHQAQQAPAKP